MERHTTEEKIEILESYLKKHEYGGRLVDEKGIEVHHNIYDLSMDSVIGFHIISKFAPRVYSKVTDLAYAFPRKGGWKAVDMVPNPETNRRIQAAWDAIYNRIAKNILNNDFEDVREFVNGKMNHIIMDTLI